MFNINSWEVLILAGLFIVLFGPDRLPEVIGQVVRFVREIQQLTDAATADLRRELDAAVRATAPTGQPAPPSSPGDAPPVGPVDASPPAGAVPPGRAPGPVPSRTPAPSPSIFRAPGGPADTPASGEEPEP